VCRTQGLPLRWVDEEKGVEHRDVCPKNDPPPSAEVPSLEDLPPAHCWTIGGAEAVIAAIAELGPTPDARLPLRALFDVAKLSPSPAPPGSSPPENAAVPRAGDASEKNS
jgi:hypothetical protein